MGDSEKKKSSIQGTLLMLDDANPHVAVPVQAIRDGEVIVTALSDEGGRYQLLDLKPGRYQIRCQVLGGYVYYEKSGNGRKWRYEQMRERGREKAGNQVGHRKSSLPHPGAVSPAKHTSLGDTLTIKPRKILENIDFRFAPFKKGMWKTYTYLDGLASNDVRAIYCDSDGVMWFGTEGGVSRYDGKEFATFTTNDGLPHNEVWAICGAPDGVLWLGTKGGISRYDGKKFTNFTTEDGLANNYVTAIHADPDGTIWFGTGGLGVAGSGISRYDGKKFVNFTMKDGLAHNTVSSIYRAPDGMVWFGTFGGGVSRYDGSEFQNFTPKDGLAGYSVSVVHGNPDGTMWFGTWFCGVSR